MFILILKIGRLNYLNWDGLNFARTEHGIKKPEQGTVTVSKDKCGTYWISVVIDNQQPNNNKKSIKSETAVGIDLGIKDYAILSDGTKYSNQNILTSPENACSLAKMLCENQTRQ